MIISTVSRRNRSRVKDLGARVIDVTPGAGDSEFCFSFELWEQYRAQCGSYQAQKEWDVMFELAMWEKSLKYPNNWLLMLNSPNVVLMCSNPRANDGRETPRAQTALAMYRVLKIMGYRKTTLGYEYSD
jgi:hypothetical protein